MKTLRTAMFAVVALGLAAGHAGAAEKRQSQTSLENTRNAYARINSADRPVRYVPTAPSAAESEANRYNGGISVLAGH